MFKNQYFASKNYSQNITNIGKKHQFGKSPNFLPYVTRSFILFPPSNPEWHAYILHTLVPTSYDFITFRNQCFIKYQYFGCKTCGQKSDFFTQR